MISEIINSNIETFIITPYEQTILTKLKYKIKLSEKEKIYLFLIENKLKFYKLIKNRGKI